MSGTDKGTNRGVYWLSDSLLITKGWATGELGVLNCFYWGS